MIWLLPLAAAGFAFLTENCGGEDGGDASSADFIRDAGKKDAGGAKDAARGNTPVPQPPPPMDYYVDAGSPHSPQMENHPPIFSGIGNVAVNEGETLDLNLLVIDPDGNSLIYRANPLPFGVHWSPGTGHILWTPNFYQAGVYPLTFFASDGRLETPVTVTVTVNNVPADKDGDGFMEEVADCNDDDPNVKPLFEFESNTLLGDTTICLGLYRGATLVVSSDNMAVRGEGVTLEQSDQNQETPAMKIQGREWISVEGFVIRGYKKALLVKESQHVSLALTEVAGAPPTPYPKMVFEQVYFSTLTGRMLESPVHFSDSHENHLEGASLYSIDLLRSDNNTLAGNTLKEHVELHSSSGNVIRDNLFDRPTHSSISLWESSNDNVVQNNIIRDGGMDLSGGTISVGLGWGAPPSNDNVVEENLLERNEGGITLSNGNDNRVLRNIIRNSSLVVGGINIWEESGEGNFYRTTNAVIERNQVTDNQGWGIHDVNDVGATSVIIRNNDLRRNSLGNLLRCDINACGGNSE